MIILLPLLYYKMMQVSKSLNCDQACTKEQSRLIDTPNTENVIKCRVCGILWEFEVVPGAIRNKKIK